MCFFTAFHQRNAVLLHISVNMARLADKLLGLASPQQGDHWLSGPPSGQGTGGGARTRNRRVPADLRTDSLATVPGSVRRSDSLDIRVLWLL
ncbi:hypothetical protein PoB_000482400 [Plakobranchus ocellatus]|uniref:Secreted protein n=1 Tax=Plakobranchus ocellatus TaxID=259542 RepID=A0AAV3Y7S4_9GAST|nr:hypothetical protein PoB_000482400 [Plakobranchus ocellatus]